MARRKIFTLAICGALLLFASAARAQEEGRHEVSVQGMGFFTKNSRGNGVAQHSTDSGGFLLSYRYHFHRWLAADGSYGYARNTQQNSTLAGSFNVQSNIHQVTGALVVTFPTKRRLKPYTLAGIGALVFDPTNNAGGAVPGARKQTQVAFVYGGGADYRVARHLFARAEYRGLVYQRTAFGLAALDSNKTAHTAQPSAGIVYRF